MKFAVIGGDMRIVRLAAMLESEGHEICCFALDEAPADLIKSCALAVCASAQDADCVILPLPVLDMRGALNAPLSAFKHDAEEILRALPKTAVICGGMLGEKLSNTSKELGLDLVDYFLREELVALNALATAEGTLAVLLENSPITNLGQPNFGDRLRTNWENALHQAPRARRTRCSFREERGRHGIYPRFWL